MYIYTHSYQLRDMITLTKLHLNLSHEGTKVLDLGICWDVGLTLDQKVQVVPVFGLRHSLRDLCHACTLRADGILGGEPKSLLGKKTQVWDS